MLSSTLDRPIATDRPRPLTPEAAQAFTSLIHKLDAELSANGRR